MNENSNSSTKNSRCEENPNLRQKNTEMNKWPYNKTSTKIRDLREKIHTNGKKVRIPERKVKSRTQDGSL